MGFISTPLFQQSHSLLMDYKAFHLVIFIPFCLLLFFFPKINVLKNSFSNTIKLSISLDPDQAQHFVTLHHGNLIKVYLFKMFCFAFGSFKTNLFSPWLINILHLCLPEYAMHHTLEYT